MSGENIKTIRKGKFISLEVNIQILDEATVRTIKKSEKKIWSAVVAKSSKSSKCSRVSVIGKMGKTLNIFIDDSCQKKIQLDKKVLKFITISNKMENLL